MINSKMMIDELFQLILRADATDDVNIIINEAMKVSSCKIILDAKKEIRLDSIINKTA